jgi:hypothetical protein
VNKYRYRLTNTKESSRKYGVCEVCKEYASEVFLQSEERYYRFEEGGKVHEGWTKNNCNSYFGHEECLKNKRR